MTRLTKIVAVLAVSCLTLSAVTGFAQSKARKEVSKRREAERHMMHMRDSAMRIIARTDTSINSLLQRIERYAASFNEINNNLADGIDTIEMGDELPLVVKRLAKINSAARTHRAGTLRYLFVLRDNLDRLQDKLEGWQGDITEINTRLVQNQADLIKFAKDSILKKVPSDSLLRRTYFAHLRQVREIWRQTDSVNRGILLKVNLLQDKIAVSYTGVLDGTDQIDARIKGFAEKAFAGESDYIWNEAPRYQDLSTAVKSTAKLDSLLLSYFYKSDTFVHFAALAFLAIIFSWIFYNRHKALKKEDIADVIPAQAGFIYRHPVLSPLLVVTVIVPFFYNHPPTVLLEIFFITSIVIALILLKKDTPKYTFQFLQRLFMITIVYAISNLLIQISSVDRYMILALGIISLVLSYKYYKKARGQADGTFPYALTVLKVFMGLQALSVVLNICGRFSLAKIVGVTAVFNLWFLLVLYVIVNIIIQAIFLQFEAKKGGNSIINWMDYNLVKKRFRQTLVVIAGLLWIFSLLQNLDIDDWAEDYVGDLLNQSQTVAGAEFTLGGFVIFILVIWLSSIVSRVISYFYDVSAQRVTDLSVLKRKNRTSALIIRIGVFSIGFLLAVAASHFPLDKLTIIISAFGVGIGFGLQNIVNNLVSGLILAFEKPINIGDVIEVDGHTGTMKEIGIRSSKVVTGDGSEVIIPNGDFISHQVVNWTLSNSNRQIDLRVITAYGVDLNQVKRLLKGLLDDRSDIMSKPAPAVFINNITESAVEFKVLFWEADISTTGELKSKILTEIYELLSKEGVQLPSTQKDLYLHFPEGMPLAIPPDDKLKDKESKGAK